jgi:hypothetical protein
MKQCQMSKTTNHRLVRSESSHAGQEDGGHQEGHHLPQHPAAGKKVAECPPLLDSQLARGEDAWLVWRECQVDLETVQGQPEDGHQASPQQEDERSEAQVHQGLWRLDNGVR